MSNILIDVSYLHSACRCIRGKATCNEDLVNYYRFLAEVIAHKSIHIVLHKGGPVYEKGIECRDLLLKESKGDFEVKVIESGKINYQLVVTRVSERLSHLGDNALFEKNKFKEDITPEFSMKNQSAIDFHEWLIAGKKQVPEFAVISAGGIYAPILIASEIDLYKRFEKPQKHWGLNDSITLAAKLRTFMYQEIAKIKALEYIPSASRGYNSTINFDTATIRDLLLGNSANYSEFKKTIAANSDVISGIISHNQYMPMDALNNSFELRRKTAELREHFYTKPWLKKGDAILSLPFERLKELENIKSEYLKKGDLIFEIGDLNPSISASATGSGFEVEIPFAKGIAKGTDFLHRKKLLKEMKSILIPILQADLTKNRGQLRTLKANAGLK